jgi:hypothetical protein
LQRDPAPGEPRAAAEGNFFVARGADAVPPPPPRCAGDAAHATKYESRSAAGASCSGDEQLFTGYAALDRQHAGLAAIAREHGGPIGRAEGDAVHPSQRSDGSRPRQQPGWLAGPGDSGASRGTAIWRGGGTSARTAAPIESDGDAAQGVPASWLRGAARLDAAGSDTAGSDTADSDTTDSDGAAKLPGLIELM